MTYTISQVAMATGVSEVSIRKWCAKHDVSKRGRSWVISSEEFSQIKDYYNITSEADDDSEPSKDIEADTNEVVSLLASQVEDLRKQLITKDEQISDLSKSLATSQAQLSTAQAQLTTVTKQLSDSLASQKALSASTLATNADRLLIVPSNQEDEGTEKVEHIEPGRELTRWGHFKAIFKRNRKE